MHDQILTALLWWVTHDEQMRDKLARDISVSLHGVVSEEEIKKTMQELYIRHVNR